MKNLYTAICFLTFSILTSCIEDYEVVMQDTENEILVVGGQIVGNKECEFFIQRTYCNRDIADYENPSVVSGAVVHVICSNGQVFGVQRQEGVRYYIYIGELDPNQTYHLRVEVPDEGVYESEPMYPETSPELKQVSYTLSPDGGTVQLRITNEDPHGEKYYMWTYDEHWEVNTPLVALWEYSPQSCTIEPLLKKINRGWCHKANHRVIIGNNLDYGNGALKDYALYTVPNTDNRFNTRYHTTIHQVAISKKEYEYYRQMELQSTQTGGIFTLMPSQLPTNIHNTLGHKAVGYVGVHLKASDAGIYINWKDVGYKTTVRPTIISSEALSQEGVTIDMLYMRGYRVYRYDRILNKSEWTLPWCIDCRDPYWGASLERPDFWQDN